MLCLVLLSQSHSNAQVDSATGNLINFTGTPTATTSNWNNGVYVHGLTCWQPGGPGNCGPNPNVQTNGNINFSYGQVNLNQVVNINNALASVGAGVQLSGFNFGFRAKNGNGWDNGQQDYLAAYVSIYNTSNKIVESYDYSRFTNRKYDWTDFSYKETFTTPYPISQLSKAQVGFIGRDTNGWAGPYGPEITNVSFSLNYRIDPCAANPASSPSCPGFSNLVKTTAVTLPTITPVPITTTDTTTASTPSVNVGGVQLSTTGSITAPDNIPQTVKDVQSATQQSTTQVAVSLPTQQTTTPSKPNMSLIMSVIGQVQAANKAVQTAAVQNANQVVAASVAKSQEQATAVVDNLNAMSVVSSQASQIQASPPLPSFTPQQQQPQTSAVQLQGPVPPSLQTLMAVPQQLVSTSPIITPPQQTIQTNNQTQNNTSVAFFVLATETANKSMSYVPEVTQQQNVTAPMQQLVAVAPPAQFTFQEPKTFEYVETPLVQSTNQEVKTFDVDMPVAASLPSRGFTAIESTEAKINVEVVQQQQTTETVNKNVSPNDLAGGVDIASIATQPKGYDVYSQLTLKDAAFYKVEDIYKNQKTIDNLKLLRGLRGGSDRLHQEMVDQQYQLGK